MADLTALVVVAEERNFTRAAVRLGLSQSALSQIVRRLEERLGVRLLARTTRSVSPTPAGEQLVQRLSPMLRDIDLSIAAINPELTTVTVDGTEYNQIDAADCDTTDGWYYTDMTYLEITLCGQACLDFKDVAIADVEYFCEGQ